MRDKNYVMSLLPKIPNINHKSISVALVLEPRPPKYTHACTVTPDKFNSSINSKKQNTVQTRANILLSLC